MPHYNLVYLSTYLDQKLSERFLLPFSPAGLNKKNQLINVMSLQHHVRLLFVCCFSRLPGRVFWRQRHEISENMKLEIPAFLTFPFLNYLFNPFAAFYSLVMLNRIKRIDFLVLYNLTYETVIPAALMKLFTGVKIIAQLEDGLNPSFGLVKRSIGKAAAWLGVRLASGVIANATNFFSGFDDKPSLLFRGVVKPKPVPMQTNCLAGQLSINVVFASTIDNVRGAALLIDFFREAEQIESLKVVNFIICGQGDKRYIDQLRDAICVYKQKGGNAEYLGFVSFDTLSSVLKSADIFLSLQDPRHSFSGYCFPSKVFEYYGHNRPIIATKISDLETDHFFQNLNFVAYEARELEKAILSLKTDMEYHLQINADNFDRLYTAYSLNANSLLFNQLLSSIATQK